MFVQVGLEFAKKQTRVYLLNRKKYEITRERKFDTSVSNVYVTYPPSQGKNGPSNIDSVLPNEHPPRC